MTDDYGTKDAAADKEKLEMEKQQQGKPQWQPKTAEAEETTPMDVVMVFVKILLLLVFLYLFIVSLDFLSAAFRLVGAKGAGVFLQNSELLQNPIAGLMIGVLVTCLLQSSSTTTSIIVTMVGAELITLRQSAFLIMGANIGTSITNTLVSMSHIGNPKEFEQGFAGATVHDIFNWLTVLCVLPLEAAFGPLEKLTQAIFGSDGSGNSNLKFDIIKVITRPVTDVVVQLDSSIVNDPSKLLEADTILKICCKGSNSSETNVTVCEEKCHHLMRLLHDSEWSDPVIGILMLVFSVALLSGCLIGLVRTLRALLGDTIKTQINRLVTTEGLDIVIGYLSIVFGAVMTFLVQSSSVFTSAITPLVGTGVITLEIMYPLTLGANIGTTATSILAALASGRQEPMQTALIHLFFNIIGILIWYPIPFLRAIPIAGAKRLGHITGKYRWFPMVYLICAFFLMPLTFFGLSLIHWAASVAVAVLVLLLAAAVAVISLLQSKRPETLPPTLQSWEFLPKPLRSLEPLDNLVTSAGRRCPCCICCRSAAVADASQESARMDNKEALTQV